MDPRLHDLSQRYEQKLAHAKAIARKSDITAAESVELDGLIEEIETLKGQLDGMRKADEISRRIGLAHNGEEGLHAAVKAAGWHPDRFGPVVVPQVSVLGKTNLIATTADAGPQRLGGIYDKGRDSRYLYPNLPNQSIDIATTVVQALIQTTRTLPSAASMQLAIDAVTEKPETVSQSTLTNFTPKMIATVSQAQPNVLFAQPELVQLLNRDMAQAYRNSLDDLVIDTIAAASGALTGLQASDVLPDFFRKAQTALNAEGFDGDIVAVNATTAERLDLQKSNNDDYMFPPGSGFWGAKIVVSPAIAATAAYVIDSSVVTVYTSPVAFEVDRSIGFTTNTSIARLEGSALAVVNQGKGILVATLNA